MADVTNRRDVNRVPTASGVTNDSNKFITPFQFDPATLRLLVNATITGGVTPNQFSTTTDTSVAASVTSVQLVAANAARIELSIQNDSTSILYIKEGTTASATDYKFKLYQDDVYRTNNYTGRIDGIWSAASGAARVTES